MLPDDWQRVRGVRLRALRDAPDAFGKTLEEALAMSGCDWRGRLDDPDLATFVATVNSDDVGLVVGGSYDEDAQAAGLYSMWVAPEMRGAGVGGALVDAVIAWARADSRFTRILLDVSDYNTAAIRLYESRSFLPTGQTGTLPPPREDIQKHQRELVL